MSFILAGHTLAKILFVVAIAIPVGVFYYFAVNKERKKALSNLDAQNYVIKMPSRILIFLNICIVLLIIMLAVLLFVIIPKNESKINLFWFGLIFLLCFSVVVFCNLRFKIVVNGEKIQYHPAFGKMQEYTFSDITRAECVDGTIVVYSNETTLFKMSVRYTNIEIFAKHLEDLETPDFIFKKP